MNWIIFTLISIIILIVDLSNSEKLCDSVNIQEIAEWANNLPALKAQDEERSSILSKFMEDFMPSEINIRKTFYEFLSQPLQTVCSVPKKLGGIYIVKFTRNHRLCEFCNFQLLTSIEKVEMSNKKCESTF